MKISRLDIRNFQKKIFSWWKHNRRDLPWRRTHDPYRILVSEVMLQQTQVSRVLPKYKEFLRLFPSVRALAAASPAAVLRAWKGMGYNRRALYLHKTAQIVVKEHGAQFPMSEQLLSKLPGVGTYTARALLVFAYRKNVSMVDTNIRQIITHFFFGDVPQKEKTIQETADLLVPVGKSWEWHQALMDYGSEQNSKFKIQNSKSVKPKIPFKQTNRFFRGRIMDMLRVGDMWEFVLIQEMGKDYDRDEPFLQGIVEGLIKDGLIVRQKNEVLGLPK